MGGEPDNDLRMERLLALMSTHCPQREVPAGEVLWHQHDLAEELAYVESGTLDISIAGRVISGAGPGEMLGEASVFMPLEERTATVRATTDTAVRICTREQLAALREQEPATYDVLLEHALGALANRVNRSWEKLARLAEGVVDKPVTPRAAAPARPPSTPLDERIKQHAAQLALRLLPPLIDIPEQALAEIAGCLTSHTMEDGETLFLQDDVGSSAYILANGELGVYRNVGSHGAIPVTTIERGGEFGLLALLVGTPRHATVVANGPVWVLEMTREAYEALGGATGRIWREALLVALREQIQSADGNVCMLEARRAERIQREFDFDDTMMSVGNTMVWPLRQTEHMSEVKETARAILRAIAPHRRLLPYTEPCSHTPCEQCFQLHMAKVERAIVTGAPVHFILPAYPAKSPNEDTKVLGKMPDMAEEQSLRYLQKVCEDIEEVYPPGGRITICSDGRVFSDLVLVSDDLVTEYGEHIDTMIERLSLASIDTFAIEQLFEVTTFEGMRDHLSVHYGEPIEQLRARARSHPESRSMYNGIHRFLFEDTLAVEKDKSRTRIRKEASSRAYGVIQRSNAFSRLIAECFPNAVRLSIHPQHPHAAKMGILLGTATDAWITPWHGVAVMDGDAFHLMKRSEAEKMGAVLVERDGAPSHFEVRT